VFTDLCVLRPHPQTKELEVVSMHPGVTAERIAQATGWEIQFADDVGHTPPPSEVELATLRHLLARTAKAQSGGDSQLI
jgi:glutaconate CoA-transferase subunit B